jgi:hypothetical protein
MLYNRSGIAYEKLEEDEKTTIYFFFQGDIDVDGFAGDTYFSKTVLIKGKEDEGSCFYLFGCVCDIDQIEGVHTKDDEDILAMLENFFDGWTDYMDDEEDGDLAEIENEDGEILTHFYIKKEKEHYFTKPGQSDAPFIPIPENTEILSDGENCIMSKGYDKGFEKYLCSQCCE